MKQQAGRLPWCILAVLIIGAMAPRVGMAQTTTRISLDLAGGIPDNASDEPLLSADGRYVAFASSASNLVAGDGNGTTDIFVYDRQAKTTTRVSVDLGGGDPDWHSSSPAISADGRFVAYSSLATDLVPGDSNEKSDIFVYDRQAGITTRVSVNLQGGDPDGASYRPALSADGRFVAFESDATNLVTGDGNGTRDIFVYDRERETTTRVSGDRQGGDANEGSYNSVLSADGRYVAFESVASNLVTGDENETLDIFVYDRQAGNTTRVSVAPQGRDPNGASYQPAFSADGRYVAFGSWASNLVAGDGNMTGDIFVYDRQTETTTRVSVGLEGGDPDNSSFNPALNADGRFVTFESGATNLVAGDRVHYFSDVFVYDQKTQITSLVSVDLPGRNLNDSSLGSALSADGRFVAFSSWVNDPPGGNVSGHLDVFLRDRGPAVIGPPGLRDLDGTGTADLLWRNSHSGEVAVWLMEGGKMGASSTLGGVPQDWQIAGSGDVDGNGTADIIWRNMTSGVVAIWMMKGSLISSIGFPGSASKDWIIKGVGDFDGNEKIDIFWRNAKSGQVSVWIMDGSTVVSTGLFHAPPSEENIAGIGDVNADGKADVLWLNTRTGKVTIWQMDGLTINFVGFPGSTTLDWDIQGVGDLDGNGTADVLWRQKSSGVVAAWLLMGSTITSSGFFKGVPAAWTMAQIGDVDGNGTADVIWHNRRSGTVAVWMMNGLSLSSVGYPGKVATEWELADH
jgi:Tol biopolymer transport system component